MNDTIDTDILASDLKGLTKALAALNRSIRAFKSNAKRGVYAAKPDLLAQHRAIIAEAASVAAQYGYGFSQPIINAAVTSDGERDTIAEALTR